MFCRKTIALVWALAEAGLVTAVPAAAARPNNVVLFIPDGLRALVVSPGTAPAMAAIRDQGVNFKNPHALFPTFTTPNASAMATGHCLGDTGDFSNTIYSGFPVLGAGNSITPFLESDPVLGDVDEHFAGDYLDEVTLLKAAREAGLSTATIGKLGPALIFDHTDRTGTPTIVVDDSTGSPSGTPLSSEVQAAMTIAELPLATPSLSALTAGADCIMAAVTSPLCSVRVRSSGSVPASISVQRRANMALEHRNCAVKLYLVSAVALPVTLMLPLWRGHRLASKPAEWRLWKSGRSPYIRAAAHQLVCRVMLSGRDDEEFLELGVQYYVAAGLLRCPVIAGVRQPVSSFAGNAFEGGPLAPPIAARSAKPIWTSAYGDLGCVQGPVCHCGRTRPV